MIRFPARLAVPLVMVPLFAISFVRVETRWRDRAVELDARDMSWDLSLYVPYHIRQGLDLHWLGLTAPAMLNLLPRSMTKMSSTPLAGPLPYGAAFASVAAVWFLFGLWMKRLNSGRRLQNRWARGAVLTAALGFGTEAWLVAFR